MAIMLLLLGALLALALALAGGTPPALLLLLLLLLLGTAAVSCRLARPLRLLRAPEAVGYLPEPGRSRAQVAQQVRRSRRTGQLPPVYPNGWFCLFPSAELARGAVRHVAALGEQFAVFRDWEGHAHVVNAYCPHLGANLAVGGRVVDNCIECPFHGWQFHGKTGRCTRIPYAEKVPDFAKIKVWPSCETVGMVLVWYHCDGIPPTWQVPEQEEVSSGNWVFRGITEHYINAHIQEIPENASDMAHLAFLHAPSVLSGVDLRYTTSSFWTFFQHHWQAEWQPDPEPDSHCSHLLLKHSISLFGKHVSLLDIKVSARQVGPGLVFLIFQHPFLGRGIMFHSITPVEPLLQHVIHRLYYQRNIPALVPKFILWAESVQFERDIMIWNNKQYVAKPLLLKEDAAIQRHRRWFSQFYSPNSIKVPCQRDELAW